MDAKRIEDLLRTVTLPDGRDVVTAGVVSQLSVVGAEVSLVLHFSGLDRAARHKVEDAVHAALDTVPDLDDVSVEVEVEELPEAQAHADAPAPKRPEPTGIARVRQIVAVASGKGGVGKSTVAVNLALALKAKGAKVGLCDIDVYGPSLPLLMGVVGQRPGVSADQKRFTPVSAYGLPVMSIGFLVEDDTPVIWRGPIVSSVVKQFLTDVEWGELDYLVVDLPPGTGDAQLTLTQSAPITGVVIVTTPSELALVDAVKGLQMFRKVETPVLGLVENMSHYVCTMCGHPSHPFNAGGPDRVAKQFGVEVLARVPMSDEVQRGGDQGKPVVALAPEGPQSAAFFALADAVMAKLPTGASPEKEKEKGGFLKGLFKR